MIERDYYPLEEAAVKLGCAESDLLHLGANGKIKVYTLISIEDKAVGFFIEPETSEHNVVVHEDDSVRTIPLDLMQVDKRVLREFEINRASVINIKCVGSVSTKIGLLGDEDGQPCEIVAELGNHICKSLTVGHLFLMAEDLYQLQKSDADDKKLSTTERNTLLRMIYGMAVEKYDYDPAAKRCLATGKKDGSIEADIAKHFGANAPRDDTIRSLLKEANELR